MACEEDDELDLGPGVAAAPLPLADDYARHLAAERSWQTRRAAIRLWERVKRCIALGY